MAGQFNVVSSVGKIPLLGDLPVIGSFFRNFDYKRRDKELVIIVTPRLVKPLARNTELPLPGDREAKPHMPEWGARLLGPISGTRYPASHADSMMPAIPRPCPTPLPSRCIRKDRR